MFVGPSSDSQQVLRAFWLLSLFAEPNYLDAWANEYVASAGKKSPLESHNAVRDRGIPARRAQLHAAKEFGADVAYGLFANGFLRGGKLISKAVWKEEGNSPVFFNC